MKFLLDTHLLLWAVGHPQRLPKIVRELLQERATQPLFSAASLWEVAVKAGLERRDFRVDPRRLRRGLTDHRYLELPITGAHAVAVTDLPLIHRDPFDRILVAQATVEGIELFTSDKVVARYPGPIRLV